MPSSRSRRMEPISSSSSLRSALTAAAEAAADDAARAAPSAVASMTSTRALIASTDPASSMTRLSVTSAFLAAAAASRHRSSASDAAARARASCAALSAASRFLSAAAAASRAACSSPSSAADSEDLELRRWVDSCRTLLRSVCTRLFSSARRAARPFSVSSASRIAASRCTAAVSVNLRSRDTEAAWVAAAAAAACATCAAEAARDSSSRYCAAELTPFISASRRAVLLLVSTSRSLASVSRPRVSVSLRNPSLCFSRSSRSRRDSFPAAASDAAASARWCSRSTLACIAELVRCASADSAKRMTSPRNAESRSCRTLPSEAAR
mmetsp:Transcript_35146/g.86196  ORF Transcript_35146/g.86196 Transcript_35146/m.86196 type:complete len:325 (+) Transcript_35146:103-1077(+)